MPSKENVVGGDDPVVSGLSRTIGTLSVDEDPALREKIGLLSAGDVLTFIGQFVQKLVTTTPTQIPLPLSHSVTTTIAGAGTTPSTSQSDLRISNVILTI